MRNRKQRRRWGALLFALFLIFTNLSVLDSAHGAKKKPNPATSPKPIWPPKGYRGIDGVYAKVATSDELVGLLSAKRSLQKQLRVCVENEFACAAVFVAAETGCAWWEVNSAVRRVNPTDFERDRIGTLVTYSKGTDSREQGTIFLISKEPAGLSVSIGNIKVICHREKENIPKPGNIYNPIEASQD